MLSEVSSIVSLQDYPKNIVAIDLGSNSFHMVVANTSHGEVRTLDKLGEKVQLGAGLTSAGEISLEAKERALDCLRRFAQRIRDLDAAAVQIVGTNALRVAKNRKTFLREAEQVIGCPIEIISGREEARLIYLGVAHTLADDQGNRLVIDIGGGSTEFIIGQRFESKALESLHMGCITFRERYFAQGELSHATFNKAIRHAASELINIKYQFAKLGWESCVGSSGSIKSIHQALEFLGLASDGIEFTALKILKDKMIELGHLEQLEKLGVKKERLTIFPSGFAILYACFEAFNIDKMTYANGALREGLLYDMMGRIEHEDVRERSIKSMQLRYEVDLQQATNVEQTVLHAYQQVAQEWNILSPQNEALLRWASQLFEIGLAISHTQYHKHGAYLILHSDLPGFSRLTQFQLSTIVRVHRRKFAKEAFSGMTEREKVLMTKLCMLFRLAVVLASSSRSAETQFTLTVEKRHLVLQMGADYMSSYPLTLANLEQEQALLAKLKYGLIIR